MDAQEAAAPAAAPQAEQPEQPAEAPAAAEQQPVAEDKASEQAAAAKPAKKVRASLHGIAAAAGRPTGAARTPIGTPANSIARPGLRAGRWTPPPAA